MYLDFGTWIYKHAIIYEIVYFHTVALLIIELRIF